MTALDDLIARLQAAQGPDRELDAEIAVLRGYARKPAGGLDFAGRECFVWAEPGELFSYGTQPPHYTSSLDSALTLVPEGSYGFAFPWFYSEYSKHEKPCVFWRAAVLKPIWEKATPTLAGDDWFERHECNDDIATPALALCIAALKARQVKPC